MSMKYISTQTRAYDHLAENKNAEVWYFSWIPRQSEHSYTRSGSSNVQVLGESRWHCIRAVCFSVRVSEYGASACVFVLTVHLSLRYLELHTISNTCAAHHAHSHIGAQVKGGKTPQEWAHRIREYGRVCVRIKVRNDYYSMEKNAARMRENYKKKSTPMEKKTKRTTATKRPSRSND